MKTPTWVMIAQHTGTHPDAHIVDERRHDGGLRTMCAEYGHQLTTVTIGKGDEHCARCLKVFDWIWNEGPEPEGEDAPW